MIDGAQALTEVTEFGLIPVPDPFKSVPPAPASDSAPTRIDLIGRELTDEAFEAMLDRPRDLRF